MSIKENIRNEKRYERSLLSEAHIARLSDNFLSQWIKFSKELSNNKIKNIKLPVSAPFHCSLMKPAAEKMREKLQNINFEKPLKNIVSNVTARSENEPENIKNLLIKQIFSTVNWRESILNIHKEKVVNFVEIGPGKVLSGMVKRTIKDENLNCFSINSIADIKNLNDKFKK